MKVWRCTRDWPYTGDCPGRTNLSARQGYYIQAETDKLAMEQMEERFPGDVAQEYGFSCHLWSNGNGSERPERQELVGDITNCEPTVAQACRSMQVLSPLRVGRPMVPGR